MNEQHTTEWKKLRVDSFEGLNDERENFLNFVSDIAIRNTCKTAQKHVFAVFIAKF